MTNEPKYSLYVACDPDTLEVRYVGETNNMRHRIATHFSDARCGENTHRCRWMNKFLIKNKKPIFEVVHTADNESDILEAEIFLIALLRGVNCRLTNSTPGGDSGIMDPEVIKRRAKSQCRPITDSNGKVYPSIKKAAQELNVSHGAIQQALKKGGRCQGFTFSRIKPVSSPKFSPEGLLAKQTASSRPIIDQHGTIYPSLKVAAKIIGCGYKGIWRVIKGRRNSIYSYTFKYVKKGG